MTINSILWQCHLCCSISDRFVEEAHEHGADVVATVAEGLVSQLIDVEEDFSTEVLALYKVLESKLLKTHSHEPDVVGVEQGRQSTELHRRLPTEQSSEPTEEHDHHRLILPQRIHPNILK